MGGPQVRRETGRLECMVSESLHGDMRKIALNALLHRLELILFQTADAMLDVAAVGDPRVVLSSSGEHSLPCFAKHESCQGGRLFSQWQAH